MERPGHGEHRIDDLAGEGVGDRDLLDQPEGDQRDPGADRDLGGSRGALELGKELARADDRPGDEVREEAQVDGGVDERGRLGVAALHVDDVGDRLEGEERDADRQQDRQQRQRQPEAERVEDVADVLDEERVVLEDAEYEQVKRYRDPADPLLAVLVVARPR